MKILCCVAFALASVLTAVAAEPKPEIVASPDGKLEVQLTLTPEGEPRYAIRRDDIVVLLPSKLGLVRDDVNFTRGLRLTSASAVESVRDQYEILTAKRRRNTYTAHRRVFHFATGGGARLDVEFQVSNDGVGFRYVFPDQSERVHRVSEEITSFHFLPDTRAWLQPMSVAKTGWSQTNPSYEEYYHQDIRVGTPSPLAGWVFPALFRAGDTWLLVSETGLGRNYCGARLRVESPDGEYTIGFPEAREGIGNGPVLPESTLPWTTPWRIIVVGTLKTVAESMLGVDLATPPASDSPAVAAAKPGRASWSWPLLGDGRTTYDVQKRFIDFAAEMGWEYTLIDALWDKQIGYEKVQELIDYAKSRKVGILLWYNSAGDWNTAPQSPRGMLLTREGRLKEFERLKQMGVAGLKIDFFGGDGQSMINYYHDIMADAAPFGFQLNFHGATLPRGWQRTYPHLMTMESIRGLEFATFEQANADQVPTHATVIPFTRNVFDPMDFTPVVLDRINKIERRTTSGFELALSVLFTSGIQHYAEIPEGMAKAPDYVRDLLKWVPASWNDSRFIDGYPGKHVVMARRGEFGWFVAGINGEDTPKNLTLNLGEIGVRADMLLPTIRDGEEGNLSFVREMTKAGGEGRVEVTMKPRGGFVMFVESRRGPAVGTILTNPSVHDPVMARQGDTYYLFCTGFGISVFSSKDLKSWKVEKPVFDRPPAWAVEAVPTYTGHTWAPDIAYHDGKYYLYYSVSAFGKNTSAIGVATNTTLDPSDPAFKWVDHGRVIQSYPGQTNWNAIDPNIITDDDGTPYMTFGSFWDGLKIVRLNPDRLSIAEDPATLKTIASRKPDPSAPNPPAPEGNPVDAGGNAIEAPFIFRRGEYYYLFTSIDYCCRGEKSTYKMTVGRAKNVLGPYVDKQGRDLARGGGTLLLEGDSDWYGLGHNSVYTFDGTDYIVFHAYDANDRGRPKLRIEKLAWDAEGWPRVVEAGSM